MKPNTDGKRHAQRHAFAIASQLIPRFNQRGISESDFWHAIKADHGVKSRSEIDELGYVKLAARLHTAGKHEHMFESLCYEITEKRPEQETEQPNPTQPEKESHCEQDC